MCSNYETVTRADRLLSFFGVARKGIGPDESTPPSASPPPQPPQGDLF